MISRSLRERVYRAWSRTCGACGLVCDQTKDGKVFYGLRGLRNGTFRHVRLTLDHIIPRALGGSDQYRNLVPLCESCNASKGHMDPWDWIQSVTDTEKRTRLEVSILRARKVLVFQS